MVIMCVKAIIAEAVPELKEAAQARVGAVRVIEGPPSMKIRHDWRHRGIRTVRKDPYIMWL